MDGMSGVQHGSVLEEDGSMVLDAEGVPHQGEIGKLPRLVEYLHLVCPDHLIPLTLAG